MISLLTLLTEGKYDYGCVMAMLPESHVRSIMDFGKQIIPDEMLYHDPNGKEEYGREHELHVTIKFGLTQSYTESQIQDFLKGTKPFFITVRSLGAFENQLFDVVKMNIEPDAELLRLRSIFDNLPNADSYKEYHPHMTLAYVKKGMGQQFKNRTGRGFSRIPINTIKYSDSGIKRLYFSL